MQINGCQNEAGLIVLPPNAEKKPLLGALFPALFTCALNPYMSD
jgi:hypothetical protein